MNEEMQAQMQTFVESLVERSVPIALKLLGALLTLVIGRIVIKWALKMTRKSRFSQTHDETVVRIMQHFVRIALYILLTVSIIAMLGVPMASIVAVIASAGVAIGLALQGALGNLAGGIMILIFRPFNLGDYVETNGFSGTIHDIGIFYTFLTTPDNKVITIPNGSIMNKPVTNYSKKDLRRVDLSFRAARGCDAEMVKSILFEMAAAHELVLKDPAPVARLGDQDRITVTFQLRVWAKSDDYWQVYYDLLERVYTRLAEEKI